MSNPIRFFSLALALILFAAAGCSSDDGGDGNAPAGGPPAASLSSGGQIQTPDAPVPDVTLETMDGETIALAERPGEVLVVNFWATWCAPCRKEIPDLIDLQEELGPRGLTVVGVSFDQEGAEVVEPFLEEYAINYPIVLDPEASLDEAFGGIYGLPMTYVVGPDGTVRYRVLGLFPVDEMRSKLVALLEEGADAPASG